MVYVDEAGIDNRSGVSLWLLRDWAALPRLQVGQTHRKSQLDCGAQARENLCPDDQCNGSCNRDLFELWLEECLVPQLQPGDVIVIDNASFHHSQSIEEIVAAAECEIWYLPPYSPDLNKIERWWFVFKNWMRQRWNEFDSFRDCVDAAFK